MCQNFKRTFQQGALVRYRPAGKILAAGMKAEQFDCGIPKLAVASILLMGMRIAYMGLLSILEVTFLQAVVEANN